MQGETSGLGELVRVARPRTERPEAELAGTVNRTGTHRQLLVGEVTLQLDPGEAYRGMVNAVDASGGGHTVKRAVAALH